MPLRPEERLIYHITDIENLPGIMTEGSLLSDAVMSKRDPTIIGDDRIKRRRLTQIRVTSAGNRFVGEFVPFYFCPRSPMLYRINLGGTGRPPGCQTSIVHLVSRVRHRSRRDVGCQRRQRIGVPHDVRVNAGSH